MRACEHCSVCYVTGTVTEVPQSSVPLGVRCAHVRRPGIDLSISGTRRRMGAATIEMTEGHAVCERKPRGRRCTPATSSGNGA
jgi:hypothetical protein